MYGDVIVRAFRTWKSMLVSKYDANKQQGRRKQNYKVTLRRGNNPLDTTLFRIMKFTSTFALLLTTAPLSHAVSTMSSKKIHK